jgi:hypothetical protein
MESEAQRKYTYTELYSEQELSFLPLFLNTGADPLLRGRYGSNRTVTMECDMSRKNCTKG